MVVGMRWDMVVGFFLGEDNEWVSVVEMGDFDMFRGLSFFITA